MEIAVLVFLFLVGSIGAAMQALKYLERRSRGTDHRRQRPGRNPPRNGD